MKKIHGGDIYSYDNEVIDFSSNINPLGVSENISEAIKNSIPDIIHYPDIECRELRKKIAENENIKYENIICGNGAAEIIYNIVQCIKPKKVLFTAPTFMEYEKASDTVNAEKTYYYLKEENNFDIYDDISDYIDNTVDMVFICNPNNPTGRCTERESIIRIIEKSRESNAFVVIDECFMDFVNYNEKYSVKDIVDTYDNIIVLKAFTKLYAIPGIRLGYGITGNMDLIENIYNIRQPWSVSLLAQIAGTAALNEKEIPKKTREYIKKERKYICDSFRNMKITFFDSHSNYILFKSIYDLDKKMLKHNILIRNCSNYVGLGKGFFRIAVRTHNENEELIKSIMTEIGGN